MNQYKTPTAHRPPPSDPTCFVLPLPLGPIPQLCCLHEISQMLLPRRLPLSPRPQPPEPSLRLRRISRSSCPPFSVPGIPPWRAGVVTTAYGPVASASLPASQPPAGLSCAPRYAPPGRGPADGSRRCAAFPQLFYLTSLEVSFPSNRKLKVTSERVGT